ncbi:hypothetical protein GWI33_008039 [Rhynchophorus ferrugineus]|uniref:Uncharacterized protein n=1 Tax=Rhynchophorus ferrugineus TaxID=354439 RepID=A0A834MEG2_RHYFE|nr:hypothetical protein GWI33_008039 [Rhynchophorus ferrugineus]
MGMHDVPRARRGKGKCKCMQVPNHHSYNTLLLNFKRTRDRDAPVIKHVTHQSNRSKSRRKWREKSDPHRHAAEDPRVHPDLHARFFLLRRVDDYAGRTFIRAPSHHPRRPSG